MVNGVFDLVHAGHLNALRQVYAASGRCVVAAVHDDASTYKVKNKIIVLSVEERRRMLAACRFVAKVVVGVRYGEITPELLAEHVGKGRKRETVLPFATKLPLPWLA